MGGRISSCIPGSKRIRIVRQPTHPERQVRGDGVRVGAGARSPGLQGIALLHARGQRVLQDPLARLAHQVGEGRQRHQLSIRERVCPCRHSVHRKSIDVVVPGWNQLIRNILRTLHLCGTDLFTCRGKIQASTFVFSNYCHQLGTQATSFCLRSDILDIYRCSIAKSDSIPTTHRPVLAPLRAVRVVDDLVVDPAVADGGAHPRLLPLLLRQPPGVHQRHLDGVGGVGAGDGARPLPRDHRVLGAARCPHLRVEVADAALRLVPHPPPVEAHVLRQAFGAPVARLIRRSRVDGRTPPEARGDVDERLVDEDRQGVEVRRLSPATQPLGLQGDGPAPCERIDDCGDGPAVGAADLRARLLQQRCV